MSGNFVVYESGDGKVLGVGSLKELANKCKISYSSLVEHYKDRHNKYRFRFCAWKIDDLESYKRSHPKWKSME